MKIRSGFVSNSSSSSFIVINTRGNYETLPSSYIINGTLTVDGQGETQFGWQNEKYSSIFDRINFAYIQTDFGQDYNRRKMLETVLKENIAGLTRIIWNLSERFDDKEKVYAYIDHQSARCNNMNMEMFDSSKNLKDFIFGIGSYIQCGNDNE